MYPSSIVQFRIVLTHHVIEQLPFDVDLSHAVPKDRQQESQVARQES